jgi:hypothetical protein
MGIFRKSVSRDRRERIMALIVTVCETNPKSGAEAAAAFDAAVEALRVEGEAAEDYMLTVASKGVPSPYEVNLWSAIYEVCGDAVVPAVAHVLTTGVVQARTQAATMLSAIAATSPEVREDCLTALREALESEEDEELREVITGLIEEASPSDQALDEDDALP